MSEERWKKEIPEPEFKNAIENEWVPPSPEESRNLYIIAGSYKQALDWAKEKNIPPPFWKSIGHVRDLDGAVGDVMYVGTYYQRDDIGEIEMEVARKVQEGQVETSFPDD